MKCHGSAARIKPGHNSFVGVLLVAAAVTAAGPRFELLFAPSAFGLVERENTSQPRENALQRTRWQECKAGLMGGDKVEKSPPPQCGSEPARLDPLPKSAGDPG